MHLPVNLFSFTLLWNICMTTVVGNNDSRVYFPSENSQIFIVPYGAPHQEIAVDQLATLRGTSVYEKYVENIIAKGIIRLSIGINKLLRSQARNSDGNILFSPLSITSALALVLLGSNGATFKQISEFWGLQSGIPDINKKSHIVHEQFARMLLKLNQTSGFSLGQEINVASAIFVQEGYPIRPIYRSTAEELYHSSILNVNFEINPQEAQKQINSWISNKTNHKIKNILNDVPSTDTKIILASALYFNAEWDKHFFVGNTQRRPFYVNGRQSNTNIETYMMANGGEFPYYKDFQLGCEILGLPYKGNKSTMYIIMPFNSSRSKLHDFESKLTAEDINNLVSRTKVTGAVILFPKMKIETTTDLKDTLKLMGVTSLFDPKQANFALLSPGYANRKTKYTSPRYSNDDGTITNNDTQYTNRTMNDFSNADDLGNRIGVYQTIDNIRQLINEQSTNNNNQNPGLYADQVLHKVFMDINEVGTEAAAATSISLTRDGHRVTFRVDVPFCFFIRHDETNTILFYGSVVLPNPNYRSN